MTDPLIGQCARCGGSLTAGHECLSAEKCLAAGCDSRASGGGAFCAEHNSRVPRDALSTDPKIIDVIAKKSPYSDQVHYYVVVDQPVKYVYTRSPIIESGLFMRVGQSFFLGRHGDFYDFLAGTERKGDAFAGRAFDIALDDGTKFHCQGDVWSCGPRKTDPVVYQIGVASLDELRKCYVFYGGFVAREALETWLSKNEASSDYYKHDQRPKYVPPPPKPRRKRQAAKERS